MGIVKTKLRFAIREAAVVFCLGAALSFSGAADAQTDSAPTPRLSPKVEKDLREGRKAPVIPPRPARRTDDGAAEGDAPQKAPDGEGLTTAPAKIPDSAAAKDAAQKAATSEASSTPAPDFFAIVKGREKLAGDGVRDWRAEAATALQEKLNRKPVTGRARNVVLMIGDGMGVATATAIRLHVNQAGGGLGEEAPLPHERFPHSALIQTFTVNAQTGDGAATATAIMSGEKTRSGVLGLDRTAVRGRCGSGAPVTRIGDLFKKSGRAVGYVTTARLTHATPAAGYAASVERLWEHDARMPPDCLQRDIAQQLIERIAKGEVDVALGGGRAAFFSEERKDASGQPGARRDGRDLIEEATANGARVVMTAEELKGVDLKQSGPVLGLFASGSMAYEHDRRTGESTGKSDEPSLAEMARSAVSALEAASGGQGYFLMIEGGRIGQASHYGALRHAVTDGAAFAEAARLVAELTDPKDTLILVTADAAHSLAFNGYCGRGSPVPGLCYAIAPEGSWHSGAPALDATGAPYETTGFLNGPGASSAAPLTAEAARDPLRRQRALIPMETETTSAADVAAYSRGPWAHLLSGLVDQPYLFELMRHAAFGPQAEEKAQAAAGAADAGSSDARSSDGDAAATDAPQQNDDR